LYDFCKKIILDFANQYFINIFKPN